MQVEGISRQNQSLLGRENAGGGIRRHGQGVEKSGESRFNTQPCDDGGGVGNRTIMMTILTFIFVVGPGVRCCGCCVCGLQGCSRCVGGSCSRCYLPHCTRHTSHVTRHTSHVTRHTSHVTYQPKPMAMFRLMEVVAAVQLPPFIAKRAFDTDCKSLLLTDATSN